MRRVKDLKDYPLQTIHAPRPAAEEAAFEESIAANGIQEPIDIMPANNAAKVVVNTVVDGHRRLAAAKKLKILNSAVRVRHDWTELSRAEVDGVFLRASIDRRNLAQVELAYMLFKLYATQTGAEQPDFDGAAAKAFVAERMGIDPRTVSRYARLFRAPLEIRTAVARGRLSLVLGEKVADLSEAAQEKLAAKVAACLEGSEMSDVVRDALPKKATTPGRASGVADRRLKMIVSGLGDLAENFAAVDPETLARYLSDLQDGAAIIASLIARARKETVAKPNSTTTKKVRAKIEPALDLDAEELESDETSDTGFSNE